MDNISFEDLMNDDLYTSRNLLQLTNEVENEIENEFMIDDSEIIGAYLIFHLKTFCECCGTTKTPQWRKGWFCPLLNHRVLLCNACGMKYNKPQKQFCKTCKEFSKPKEPINIWMRCLQCKEFYHKICLNMLDDIKHIYVCSNCLFL